MTAGTVFLMWLGEQIDEFGIGNGISLLIMAGILARMPGAVYERRQADPADAAWNWAAAGASSASKSLMVLVGALRRRWWPAWSSSRWASAAFPRKAPSTSAAGASSAAPGNICRCGSTRPASCPSSSPAAC